MERDAILARELARLPARQRAAMTLVYDEGLSGAEAAEPRGSGQSRAASPAQGPKS